MESKRFVLLGIVCVLIFYGCSTKRNTSGTRVYHAFTTRYNAFFNAQQAYDETLNAQYDSYRDDFSRLLPMYPTDTAHNKETGGPFDGVIEKTMKAIREHSIATKPRRDVTQKMAKEYREWLRQEEFNPFLKNVWLLMGKAQTQNTDYTDAISTFSQILRMYPNENDLISETQIWMVRCYTALEWFYDAENLLNILRTKRLPKNLTDFFNETFAYYLLQRKDYVSPIPYLQQTIQAQHNVRQKKRLQYLTAQLYELQGQRTSAFDAFEKIKSVRTPSELVVQATIAQLEVSAGNQQQQKITELEKMTKISRYKDHLAELQIALGNMYTAKNDTVRANKFYAEAKKTGTTKIPGTTVSVTDSVQTPAESAALLAEQRSPEREMLRAVARARNLRSQPYSPDEEITHTSAGIDSVRFNPNRDISHLFLLLFAKNRVNKNNLLFAVANYNFSTFMLREFRLSFVEIGSMEALQIKSFNSYEEASEYGKMLSSDSTFVAESPQEIIPLIISEENMQILSEGKTLADYQAFYKANFGDIPEVMALKQPENIRTEIPAAKPKKEKAVIAEEPEPAIQKPTKAESTPVKHLSVEEVQAGRQAELERKEAEVREKQTGKSDHKARRKILKERERERQKLLKQREREREALLKQRAKELKEKQLKRERELKNRAQQSATRR